MFFIAIPFWDQENMIEVVLYHAVDSPQIAIEKYEEMFPAFSDSRECKLLKVTRAFACLLTFPFISFLPASHPHFVALFLQKLLEAHEEQNSDAFTEAVSLCNLTKEFLFFWVPLLHSASLACKRTLKY